MEEIKKGAAFTAAPFKIKLSVPALEAVTNTQL